MPKKITKKKEMADLDKAWSLRVRKRDDYTCQICKKKLKKQFAQAHHILPRTIKGTRWDIDNGVTLCYSCHKVGQYAAHQNALWFSFWLKTNKNKQFWYVIKKLKEIGKKERAI